MSNKPEILVIECISSAVMYVEEIIDRGYKAFVINPICDSEHIMETKHRIQKMFEDNYDKDTFECVYAQNNSEDIYQQCQGHNIVCAVAGSEFGVKTVDEVASRLGLPGNDPKTNYKRCTKSGMVESLQNAGIRAIQTANVNSDEDIINFYRNNDIKKSFMKFSEGAGSFGNKACNSMEDAINYYQILKTSENYYGATDGEILIQEFIDGPEYVVNTVSSNGKHVITDMWKYSKIVNDEGDTLYHTSTLIEEVTPEVKDLVDYALKVLDAVDVKYGPVHAEYKIDHKGPVLIETNCRPMGDSTTREYARDVAGNCIVDWALDGYLNPDKFATLPKEYHSKKSAIKKYIILSKDIQGDMAPGFFLAEKLKTFHNHNDYEPSGVKAYEKTRDLSNTPMILKLASDDKEQLLYDIDLIHFIEDEFIELLVYPNQIVKSGDQPSIEEITERLQENDKNLERADQMTRTLVLTDKDAYEVCNGKYCPVGDQTPQIFDAILYADCSEAPLVDKLRDMHSMYKYLKPGGNARCCNRVAQNLPYGTDCFEILAKF